MSKQEFEPQFAAGLDGLVKSVYHLQANDALSAADRISQLVKTNLKFQSIDVDNRYSGPLTAHSIAEAGHTNCYGYSIITSEMLSYAGIESYIIYVNRHAMVLAIDQDSNRSMILSIPETRLNSEVNPDNLRLLNGVSSQDLNQPEDRRFAAILHSDRLLDNCPKRYRDRVEYMESWLDISHRKKHVIKEVNPSKFKMNHSLRATLTPAVVGRTMLASMYNFEYLAYRGSQQAGDSLLQMRGVWPEIDKRNLVDDNSYILNQYLLRTGITDPDGLVEKTKIIEDSAVELTEDLSVKLWRPDMIRKVAYARRDSEMMELAIDGYRSVFNRHRSALVQGKLVKTMGIATDLKRGSR